MTEQTTPDRWKRIRWGEVGISVLINALFVGLSLLFFAYAQPWLLVRTTAVYLERTPDYLLGLLMIAVGIIESVGICLKWSDWQQQPAFDSLAQKLGVALLLMLHSLIDMLWGFFLLASLDLMDFGSGLQCLLGPVVLVFFIFHLALVMAAIYSFLGTSDGKMPTALHLPTTSISGLIGDALLLISSLVMFCISWDFMQAISPPPEGGWQLASYTFIYLWCYFSARSFSILPEWGSQPSWVQKIIFWIFLLIGWLGTFQLLPTGS